MNYFSKIFFLVAFLVVLSSCTTSLDDETKAQKLLDYNENKYKDSPATGEIVEGVRVIDITAHQFYWDPNVVVVNKDEKVKLVLSTVDIPHGFEIEGFQIPDYDFTEKIEKNKPLTIEFTPREEGVWDFLCSIYCGAGHGSMKGKFVVR